MTAEREWKSGKSTNGDPTRDARFESAGRALALARERNRDIEKGGSSCPVLIEGIKDVKALRKLGFTGIIEQLNRGWGRSRLVAYLFEKYGCNNPNDGGPALILLMDWDRTGGRIQNDMSMRLRGMDISLDEETRMELVRAMKPEGKTVESLAPFAKDLLEKMSFHDPDGSDGEE
jgi:5S rRNA maturation endonuclease (ribonuclease M5)